MRLINKALKSNFLSTCERLHDGQLILRTPEGERYWPSYFAMLKRSLAEGGRVLLQAITVKDSFFDTYKSSSDYIRQYVFPGGMLLSDRVIEAQASNAGFAACDSFAFGQDYARTCRNWANNLTAQKRRV